MEEDFSSKPDVALHLSLSKSVNTIENRGFKYLFADTLVVCDDCNFKGESKLVDYLAEYEDYVDWLIYKGLINVVQVNGTRIPLREKKVPLTGFSAFGYYDIVSNLNDIISAQDFDSIKILLYDPIEGKYKHLMEEIIYGYSKEHSFEVETAYIHFLENGKKVVGQIKDLPDTTLFFDSFYSSLLHYVFPHFPEFAFVIQAEFQVKRKLITFTADNEYNNEPPYFTRNAPRSSTLNRNSMATFYFEAVDPDGDKINFDVFSDQAVNFDSNSGKFQFKPSEPGEYFFVVTASDGKAQSAYNFVILATDKEKQLPEFVFVPENDSLSILSGELLYFWFLVRDSNMESLYIVDNLISYEIVESSAPPESYYLSLYSGKFFFLGGNEGSYSFTIRAISKGDTIYHEFTISVDSPVDINRDYLFNDLHIYPNPAKNIITIDLGKPYSGKLYLQAVDALGKVSNLTSYSISNQLNYDISHLKSGIYIFRLSTENDLLKISKIIKQ